MNPKKTKHFMPFWDILEENKRELIPLINTNKSKLQRLRSKLMHNTIHKEIYNEIMVSLKEREQKKYDALSLREQCNKRAEFLPEIKVIPNLKKLKESNEPVNLSTFSEKNNEFELFQK